MTLQQSLVTLRSLCCGATRHSVLRGEDLSCYLKKMQRESVQLSMRSTMVISQIRSWNGIWPCQEFSINCHSSKPIESASLRKKKLEKPPNLNDSCTVVPTGTKNGKRTKIILGAEPRNQRLNTVSRVDISKQTGRQKINGSSRRCHTSLISSQAVADGTVTVHKIRIKLGLSNCRIN